MQKTKNLHVSVDTPARCGELRCLMQSASAEGAVVNSRVSIGRELLARVGRYAVSGSGLARFPVSRPLTAAAN